MELLTAAGMILLWVGAIAIALLIVSVITILVYSTIVYQRITMPTALEKQELHDIHSFGFAWLLGLSVLMTVFVVTIALV